MLMKCNISLKNKIINSLIILNIFLTIVITILFFVINNIYTNNAEYIFVIFGGLLLMTQVVTIFVVVFIKKYENINKETLFFTYKIYCIVFIICLIIINLSKILIYR